MEKPGQDYVELNRLALVVARIAIGWSPYAAPHVQGEEQGGETTPSEERPIGPSQHCFPLWHQQPIGQRESNNKDEEERDQNRAALLALWRHTVPQVQKRGSSIHPALITGPYRLDSSQAVHSTDAHVSRPPNPQRGYGAHIST
jgi:hypothetical protein